MKSGYAGMVWGTDGCLSNTAKPVIYIYTYIYSDVPDGSVPIQFILFLALKELFVLPACTVSQAS